MYLTKSRFKIGISCPTKLYYEVHPNDFHNTDDGNEFMKALAEGGLQVGELAKLYYPGGVEIDGVSDELKADKEVVMAAGSNDKFALKFASEELQNDPDIIALKG